MPLASLMGWGGVTVGTLTTFAQVVRVRRVGADGVNATTWSLFAIMSVVWLAYGLSSHSHEIVAGTLIGAPFFVWLLSMLDPMDRWRGLGRAALAVAPTTWVPAALF